MTTLQHHHTEYTWPRPSRINIARAVGGAVGSVGELIELSSTMEELAKANAAIGSTDDKTNQHPQ